MSIRISVIGAGSTYTPELVEGVLARQDRLPVEVLILMDIDPQRLKVTSDLAERMAKKAGNHIRIHRTTSLEEALKGSDFVLTQIRVGGLEARILDERIPLSHGLIGQETTGIGGFFKALRTIPVIMDIARRMERLCPKAFLINFSNPAGLVTEAVANRTDVRMVGLCNGPINMIRDAKRRLGVENETFDYDFVGLNHLCWLIGARTDGKERIGELLETGSGAKLANLPEAVHDPELLNIVPGIPIAYLQYYYYPHSRLEKLKNEGKTRGEVCQEIETELFNSYRNPALDVKPAALEKRGGALYSEAAMGLVEAITLDKRELHVADVRNQGSYPWMAENDVVETKCFVDRSGLTPLPLRGFTNGYVESLMHTIKAYEKAAAVAALEGNRKAALEALLIHPLVRDFDAIRGAFEELLNAHKRFILKPMGDLDISSLESRR